ncbi:MAG: oligoendopeptidase F [Spirochaetia bacterium]
MNIPTRDEIRQADKWDLKPLFRDDETWEQEFIKYKQRISEIGGFKELCTQSPEKMKAYLDFVMDLRKQEERLGHYVFLKKSEDTGESSRADMYSRFLSEETRAESERSFFAPKVLSLSKETITTFLASEELKEYRIYLEKLVRFKPYVLSEEEEKLLAMQEKANQTPQNTFSVLTNVDMNFGSVETKEGEKQLSQASFYGFMQDPDRDVREAAYTRFMQEFNDHKQTLSSLYAGSVDLDIYKANARGFENSRAAALFPDKVPEKVYDQLIEVIHSAQPMLHEYYRLRKEVLNVDQLRQWDVLVPLVKNINTNYPYEEAVKVCTRAVAPLGEEYQSIMQKGLLSGWVDKYENRGKRTGAFSLGGYEVHPYILMNYKEDVLSELFTLIHEAGHAMHSWYSAHNNPIQHYNYTIFEAEVASTFNEQLLIRYLLENTESKHMKAYLANKQLDSIVATFFRQTMFAEFEYIAHSMAEENVPLTVDSIREMYKGLLSDYFGDAMVFTENCDLEALRIPHFYRAFYVYKYATGLSAAIALSKKVLEQGVEARNKYLDFLKSGGSKYPLESLKTAGVDMTKRSVYETVVETFSQNIQRLKEYFKG